MAVDQPNPQNRNYDVRDRGKIEAPVLTPDESRQGVMTGHIRWILYVSVALAVIAGIVLYAIFV
jgi:hypothetical protein